CPRCHLDLHSFPTRRSSDLKIIRRLYDLARTKGSKKYIIIDYAETMAKPAQNAFLKLLEEPNDQIHFILLSHQPQSLLPTIMSRSEEHTSELQSRENLVCRL